MSDFWEDAEVISSYSRADALEDGVLVDVTETAREAGIRYPVALTAAVFEKYVEVPDGVQCQDVKGRLWDVIWMFRVAAKKFSGSTFLYQLHVRNDNRPGFPPMVKLKAVCGSNDDGSPCITIMLPEED